MQATNANNGAKNKTNESTCQVSDSLRSVAYSMDLLIPGFYIWIGNWGIKLFGGDEPEDTPYRYPGTIHSPIGAAFVLPGYKIFSTYTGTYDPR